MTETTFPPELIERCAHALNRQFRTGAEAAEVVLRESGHDKLVAALVGARDYVALATQWSEYAEKDVAKIDAALKAAGVSPLD